MVTGIPTTQVDSIEQYLNICQDLERRAPKEKLFFRGQIKEYTLPICQISLLPKALRETPINIPTRHPQRLHKAYGTYMDIVLNRHTEFVSRSSNEQKLFRRLLSDPVFRLLPEGDFLANTPVGRFLLSLFGPRATLFEATLQHYGYQTLNLDATYSPLVALYFATHELRAQESGALRPEPMPDGGLVYVMALPDKGLTLDGKDMGDLAGRGRVTQTRPRIADLFELSFDNNSRPRRQYAILLAEMAVLYWDGETYRLPDGVQCNSCSYYVQQRIRLSRHFWDNPGVHRFIGANLGTWFFPDPKVDLIFRELRSADPRNFPVYEVGKLALRHPHGQFEFLQHRRIVLTGGDAQNARDVLASSWFERVGWLEILPFAGVMSIASDRQEREPLDVVVACEKTAEKSNRLKEIVLDEGQKAGRTFVALESFPRGDIQSPIKSRYVMIGGELWTDVDDLYEDRLQHQRALVDALLSLSRIRYERVMRPEPSKWESFLELVSGADRHWSCAQD
jgi:hypothetical protein